MEFPRLVFEYLASIVPYWRVSDDAWPLTDGSHLAGIGVLRNYGGGLLVVPCELDDPGFAETARRLQLAADSPVASRVIAMADDRSSEAWTTLREQLAASASGLIRWTERDKLKNFVEPLPALETSAGKISAPDGSTAEFDREATAAVYAGIPDSDCTCKDCRNYRAALSTRFLDPAIIDACALMGIDPRKPRETTKLDYDKTTNMISYYGHLVFVGTAYASPQGHTQPGWHFTDGTRGYDDEFGPVHAALWFEVSLPWVLEDEAPL